MGSPTSVATENPERRRQAEASSKGTPAAATDYGIDAAYSDEQPYRGPWPSEASPSGMLPGMLGEMVFCYGACWLHHRSAQRRGKP